MSRRDDTRHAQPDLRTLALLEHSRDVIGVAARDGVLTYVNPAVTTMFGFRPEELIGRSFMELVHADDLPLVTSALRQILETADPLVHLEVRLVHRDGSVRWVDATMRNMLDDPAVAGIVGNLRDITDRHQAFELLAQSERRYRQIIETTREGVCTLDRESRITFVNRRMTELVGFSVEELLHRPMTDLLPPHEREGFLRRMVERSRGRAGYSPSVLLHRDGSPRQVWVESTPLHDERGEFSGVLGMISDMTERHAMAEALRASERRFARLEEAGIIGIAIAELEGPVVHMNPTLLDMLGLGPEDLTPTLTWRSLTAPGFEAVDVQAQRELLSRGVAPPIEKELLRKDGTRVPVLVGMARLDDRKKILFAIDLTAQKRAEAEADAMRAQLLHAQKMEAVGRLAGGVAHDFNNILSVMLGVSETLLEEGACATQRDDLQEIHNAALRGADLTRQLLQFSRQQRHEPRVIAPGDVLRNMHRMLLRVLREDVNLHLEIADGTGRVCIDPGQLEQVVMNLAINARDAMPGGGRLTIEVDDVVLDGDFARKHLDVVPGPYVRVAVSDTGTGMDRDTMSRVFEPFFTTKDKTKGTGLGLSTVFGIVRQAAGSIWVYSELGRGSTFKIYLPRVDRPVDPAPPPLRRPVELHGDETLLLVEDDTGVRQMLAQILQRAGYRVLVADDAFHAIELAAEHPELSLLVSDVVMPGLGGRELARRILALREGIAVLHVSGYTDDTVVRDHLVDAHAAFLQKPIMPTALLREVRRLLDARAQSKPTSSAP